jgi:diacylglycerol kinase family enzyme
MSDRRYYVLLNEKSGTAHALGVTKETLSELFSANGIEATVDADCERSMGERVADALASDAQVVVAAGGDGTVTALAGALVGLDKDLAVLPLGTFNAVAKDLHLPLDLRAAVAALAQGKRQRIDLAEVNGRIFMQKVVIGLIPGLAAGRELIRGQESFAAKLAFLRHVFRRLARARRMAVVLEPGEGDRRIELVQSMAVACDSYDEGLGKFFSRQDLNQGTLTLYLLHHFTAGDLLRLLMGMLMGRWQDDEALSMESVKEVTIDVKKRLINVMIDGEVEALRTPLKFRILPRALSVIVPSEEKADTEAVATPA